MIYAAVYPEKLEDDKISKLMEVSANLLYFNQGAVMCAHDFVDVNSLFLQVIILTAADGTSVY